jgi:transposase
MFYGLDVHKHFIQVCALTDDGKSRRDFRIAGSAEAIEAFGKGLERTDAVVLEATFHTWAIAQILGRFVDRVAVAHPSKVRAIADASIKTDKIDAHTLAQLLRLNFLPEVRLPNRKTWALRQLLNHRRHLMKQAIATKNAIHGVLNRGLHHYPGRRLFTAEGYRWLAKLRLPATERMIVDQHLALLRQIEERQAGVDAELLRQARLEHDVKLLVTIPGVDLTVALGFLATIGSVGRFEDPHKLAAYFGLVPKVFQSGNHCYTGRITKTGSKLARWLAVEAAQSIARSSSPLAASYHRIRRRKGHAIAVTALARKLVVVVWHVLTKQEPYRYAAPARTRFKLRRLEAGAPRSRRVPESLEEVYLEASLELSPPSAGEKRAAANNRRALTRLAHPQTS